MSEANGIQWLVEQRDALLARVAVLENELVRRDAAQPTPSEAFHVEVSPLDVRALTVVGNSKAIADLLAERLAREVVYRSVHRISVMPDGAFRLYFLPTVVNP